MRILFLTQVLPYPLVGGAKTRAYFVLRQLALENDITLVSYVRESDSPEYLEHLRQYCVEVHPIPIRRSRLFNVKALLSSFWNREPIIILRDRQPEFLLKVEQLITENSFEAIHADQTAMAQFALDGQKIENQTKPKIILDQHNALFRVVERQSHFEPLWIRPIWKRESRRLLDYEINLCREFDRIFFVTDADRELLYGKALSLNRDLVDDKFITVPICVDPTREKMVSQLGSEHQIIYIGTMFWPPNRQGILWFAREVMPLIWESCPDTKLLIVGRDPSQEVRNLKRLRTNEGGGIVVRGFIENVSSVLDGSRIFIVPLFAGGGMRVKILDAWAWGVPVVSTSTGAEGIDVRPGKNILIADEPEAFADAVLQVLTNDQLAIYLREQGRKTVERYYDWQKIYPKINRTYRSLY